MKKRSVNANPQEADGVTRRGRGTRDKRDKFDAVAERLAFKASAYPIIFPQLLAAALRRAYKRGYERGGDDAEACQSPGNFFVGSQ